MDQKILNTPLACLTVGQLLEIIEAKFAETSVPKYTTGISGLAKLFGVSISTAKRIKASGMIDQAISQTGRTIVTDSAKAMELYAAATHGRRK